MASVTGKITGIHGNAPDQNIILKVRTSRGNMDIILDPKTHEGYEELRALLGFDHALKALGRTRSGEEQEAITKEKEALIGKEIKISLK